jgi:hypothetical protein
MSSSLTNNNGGTAGGSVQQQVQQQQQRRNRIVPMMSSNDDFARFGEDAKRNVYLVKIPTNVMDIWRSQFQHGGIEYTRNTGMRDLEPKVELGDLQLIDGEVKSGSIITIPNTDKPPLQFKLNLRSSAGLKQRIISCEVGERGQNVKFEGIVEQTGSLMPIAVDDTYKEILKERVDKAEVKVQVKAIGQKEELEAMRKQGRIIIKGTGLAASAEEAEAKADGAGHASKRQKVGPDGKKKKPVKKKERDVSFEAVKEPILKCFNTIDSATGQKKQYWKRKELRKTTGLQFHYLNPVLTQIAKFHTSGPHNKTYSLLPNVSSSSSSAAAGSSTSSETGM